jgi:uncharacterized protein (DUF1697 family)
MPRVAAFLRAINITGRRVTNDRLVALVSDAGFADVSAYQAAGNLLLDPGDRDPAATEADLDRVLEAGLGYLAEAFVRTAEDLAAVLAAVPFDPAEVAAASGKPQVGFLRRPVPSRVVADVAALGTEADRIAVIGRELHWLPIGGVGRSALDLTALSRDLGPMTVRTLGTVERIAAKLDG